VSLSHKKIFILCSSGQREIIKEVRRKALDELEKEKEGEDEGASSVGNYRIIVVGQQTMKPRAVKVPLRN